MSPHSWLKNFPISWFAVVMGLSGLAIAWSRAEAVLSLPLTIGTPLALLSAALFVLLAVLYGLKAVLFRADVAAEFRHPVKLHFFPTISIGLILLGTAFLHLSPQASFWLWAVGTVAHLLFTLYVLTAWIHHTHFEIHHSNPAWFIPVVGNILVPIAGVHHAAPEVSWFFFSIGLVFWLVLLTIIMNRVIFHAPLPERLLPTLFILIAPPAVGFLSWVRLTGGIDAFAHILFDTALFLTLLLLVQASRFVRLRFFLSWWAYSFPMAAITTATLTMYERAGPAPLAILSVALLCLLTLLILVLVTRTLAAVRRREICVEEG